MRGNEVVLHWCLGKVAVPLLGVVCCVHDAETAYLADGFPTMRYTAVLFWMQSDTGSTPSE